MIGMGGDFFQRVKAPAYALRSYAGTRVFVITEHSRVRGLISTVTGQGGSAREITTEGLNNKFVLVEADLAPVGARRR